MSFLPDSEHVTVDLSYHVSISIKNDTHSTFPLAMTESWPFFFFATGFPGDWQVVVRVILPGQFPLNPVSLLHHFPNCYLQCNCARKTTLGRLHIFSNLHISFRTGKKWNSTVSGESLPESPLEKVRVWMSVINCYSSLFLSTSNNSLMYPFSTYTHFHVY